MANKKTAANQLDLFSQELYDKPAIIQPEVHAKSVELDDKTVQQREQQQSEIVYPIGINTNVSRAIWEVVTFGKESAVWAYAEAGLLLPLTTEDITIIMKYGLNPDEYINKIKEAWK